MKKASISWGVKQFNTMVTKGKISFDYPIQRQGGQWDHLQKSLLIHSLANDFPIPHLYSIVEEKVYYILDGKQRLSSILDYVNNLYSLHPGTPSCTIFDVEYELAGKTFEELDEEVRTQIESTTLSIYKLDETNSDEIEELFYRLNNGTPLSKMQKAKPKMGTEWAKELQSFTSHELMSKSSFTHLQIRRAEDEMSILQAMMLLDQDIEFKSFSSNHVLDYAISMKGRDMLEVTSKLHEVFEYLNKTYKEKERVMLKKLNFPILIVTASQAIENGIEPEKFLEWSDEFKLTLQNKDAEYLEYCGAGSIKKDKVVGRVNKMMEHLQQFFQFIKAA